MNGQFVWCCRPKKSRHRNYRFTRDASASTVHQRDNVYNVSYLVVGMLGNVMDLRDHVGQTDHVQAGHSSADFVVARLGKHRLQTHR